MPTPRAREVGQRSPGPAQHPAFVTIQQRCSAGLRQQDSTALRSRVFDAKAPLSCGLGHHLVNDERAELLLQVQRQARAAVLVRVQEAEDGVQARGIQRGDALAEKDAPELV